MIRTGNWPHRKAISALIIFVLGYQLRAQCQLRPADQSAMARLETMQNQPGYAFRKAQVFMNAGCLEDAKTWYSKAKQSISDQDEARDSKLNAIEGSMKIVDAIEKFKSGDRKAAIQDLASTVQQYDLMTVKPVAIMILARLALADPDPHGWSLIEAEIKDLADNIGGVWQARLLITDHELAAAGAEAAVLHLNADLSADTPFQRRLMLQLLMAYVLDRSGRIADAEIMLKRIEGDFGRYILDADLRVFFLRVAVSTWQHRVGLGGDSKAKQRLSIYRQALAEAETAQ